MRARGWVPLLVLLSTLPGLPPAAAAQPPLLEDAKGDAHARMTAQGTEAPAIPAANPATDIVDLVSLHVEETLTDLIFTVTTAATPQASGRNVYLDLTWGTRPYRVEMSWFHRVGGQPFIRAALVDPEANDFDPIAALVTEVDAGTSSQRVVLPRAYLLDADRNAPARGQVLEDVRVLSEMGAAFWIDGFAGYRITDQMPEDGGATYTMLLGDHWGGSLRLTSPQKVRVSNGEATTFVYHVNVENVAAEAHDFTMVVSGLPEGWTARVPDRVSVAANAMKTVPVLASIPFGHEHGGFTAFTLTVTSERDPASTGEMRLGVLHTPIPQPAGHHAELYVHHAPRNIPPLDKVLTFGNTWMDTVADAAPEHPEIPVSDGSGDGVTWWIPLAPALEVGLDFDMTRLGLLEGAILARRAGEALLVAELRLVDGVDQDARDLAEMPSIPLAVSEKVPVTMDLRAAVPFKLDLTPTPEADYVPYAPARNLMLVLELRTENGMVGFEGFLGSGPVLDAAAFKMSLPLLEYHDRVAAPVDAGASSLVLTAAGQTGKVARPGTLVTYAFDLTNHAETEETVDVDLAGTDAGLAEVVPAGGVVLAPGGTRRITVAVQVPPEAVEAEVFEVLVFAHARADPSRSAVGRTLTTAALGTVEGIVADETDVLVAARDAEKETPGLPLGLLVGSLGFVAWRRRRAGGPEGSSKP